MADENIIKGNWKQLKGHAQKRWAKLTDDDLHQIEGNRKILVGKIQERYGKTRDLIEKEVNEWEENPA